MPRRALIIIGASILFLVGAVALVTAEGKDALADDALCSSGLETIWAVASDACITGPVGYICNGGVAPLAEPQGLVSNALAATGALVEVDVVDAIQTLPLAAEVSSGGVAWLRLPPPIAMSGLMIGEVTLRDVSPPDFPAWQSIVVSTGQSASATCATNPRASFILESAPQTTSRIVINGVSVSLNGAAMVQTGASETLFVTLAGRANLLAQGQEQPVLIGQQASVPYNPGDFSTPVGRPSASAPLDIALMDNLPVALLERPVGLPQPGYVVTDGTVNMRSEPSLDGALLAQIAAGEVMSVLGQNTAGDWLHVRLDNGLTGWMFADLLQRRTGFIDAVYDETPVPPQRYGEIGDQAIVRAPAGANLRAAPDVQFNVLTTLLDGTQVELLARSPYSPWVKVDANGMVGWLAMITLDSAALVDALPIDWDVPPPPAPTAIPGPRPLPRPAGSYGNAFPDPNEN